MNRTISFITRSVVGVMLLGLAAAAEAQWIVPPTPANQLSVNVTVTVVFNSVSGLYEYDYQIANSPSSAQKAVAFALRLQGTGLNGTAPTGWSFGRYEARPMVEWAATEAAPDPPGFIDDGSLPLAAHSIGPGAATSGFKLVSPDPPGTVTYYVKGEVPEPVLAEDGDADALPAFDSDIEVDSVSGSTIGPVPVAAPEFFEGGRRPATDAFLVFVNLVDGDVRTNRTSIIVKFGARGETVDQSSFRAELNGVDVTAAFVAASAPGDLAGLFTVGSSPLKVGKNVLLTSISGIIPSTGRMAGDVDRVTFTVQ